MVLLVALEDDLGGLGMLLQRRVEDLLLDDLVDRQLLSDPRVQLFTPLDAALRPLRYGLGERR